MAIALVTHVESGTNSNGTTSSSIDSTGGNFIAIGTTQYEPVGAPTLSDSKGNTYTALTREVNSSNQANRISHCANATVGSGHTFTLSGTGQFPSLSACVFSGVKTASPFDQQNGNHNSAVTSLVTNSVTPSEDNELLFTTSTIIDGTGASTVGTINGGFTLIGSLGLGLGNYYGIQTAYLVQTAAAAANPTWSWTGSFDALARIATFKAAPGGGPTTGTITSMLSLMGVG